MQKVIMAWSGGKDSAMAFEALKKDGGFEVVALLTTVTEVYGRISMHGVREELLESQARALGIPLDKIYLSQKASDAEYEQKMRERLLHYRSQNVSAVAFGDIFLEDLRKYRESNLAKVGMSAVFPLWKKDTARLGRTFIDNGFRAIVTCADSKSLDRSFAGRVYDCSLLADLPPSVDPCGENGEFHSFVYGGPIFHETIPFERGEVVLRDERFYFCDLLPIRQTGLPAAKQPGLEKAVAGVQNRI
ncbi:MAG: diphthine--ammonia ligase [Candidatus Omnitrophica bacterium]|nr:diphthine--ammonia ligase [Candidatus Omnitrophota bacterium]